MTMAHATAGDAGADCRCPDRTGMSGLTFSIVAGVLGRRFPPEKPHGAGHLRCRRIVRQFAILPATRSCSRRSVVRRADRAGCDRLASSRSRGARRENVEAVHTFKQSAGKAVPRPSPIELPAADDRILRLRLQVVFFGVHLPSYLADNKMAPHVAVTALMLIGLFNIVGTYATGWLGSRMPKRFILSAIYFGRSIVIALFVFMPLTVWSVYAFAIALGLLWLSTVPPTNSLVAQIFGVRYLSMLAGFTFLSTRSAASSARAGRQVIDAWELDRCGTVDRPRILAGSQPADRR